MSRFEIRFSHRIPLPLVSIPLPTSAFPNTKKNSNEAIQRSYYSNVPVGMGFWSALQQLSVDYQTCALRKRCRPVCKSAQTCTRPILAAARRGGSARGNCENREYPGSSSCFRSTRRGNASSDFQNGGGQRDDRFGNDK